MISIGIINAPVGSQSWMPIVYAGETPYYPETNLDLATFSVLNVDGTCDVRVNLYSTPPGSYTLLAQKELYSIPLVDAKTYIFNWSAGTLAEEGAAGGSKVLPIIGGVALAFGLLLSLIKRKR